MAKIRSSGTRPEMIVAKILRSARYHFTQNDLSLPGTPDFLLRQHKLAIFVHGCFWHRHSCRRGKSTPSTRAEFWECKRIKNVQRDQRALRALRKQGFRTLTLWECFLKDPEKIKARIVARLKSPLRKPVRK